MDISRWFVRLPLKNVVLFTSMQLVAALIPFAVLPVVTRTIGPEGWVSLALGIGVGGVAALVIAYGWPLRGPGLVAAVPASEAEDVYTRSLYARLAISLPVVIPAALLAAVLASDGERTLAAAMAIATALNGLSSSWFFVARARPGLVALTDVAPKVAGSLLSIPLVVATGSGLFYPLGLMLSVLAGVLLTRKIIASPVKHPSTKKMGTLEELRLHWPLVASAVVLTGYGAFAVPLSSLAPGASVLVVGGFAAAVRLRSMVQVGISSVTSAFQGWALAGLSAKTRKRRLEASLLANLAVGLLAGVAFGILAPEISNFFFGPSVDITRSTAWAIGMACVPYAVSASLSYQILGPSRETRAISRGTLAGALTGIPAVFVGTTLFGATGAAGGVALAEVMVAAVQLPPALRVLRTLV